MVITELALRDARGAVVPPAEIQTKVLENVGKMDGQTFMASMFGGGILSLLTYFPVALTASLANIPFSDFTYNTIANAALAGGAVFGFWRSSQGLRFINIEEVVKKNSGDAPIGKIKTIALKRTFKEKRIALPIEKGFKTETGKEILGATLVTSRKGYRVELALRENPLNTWDNAVATVKEIHSLRG